MSDQYIDFILKGDKTPADCKDVRHTKHDAHLAAGTPKRT